MKKKSSFWVLLAVLAVGGLIFASCGGGGGSTGTLVIQNRTSTDNEDILRIILNRTDTISSETRPVDIPRGGEASLSIDEGEYRFRVECNTGAAATFPAGGTSHRIFSGDKLTLRWDGASLAR